MASAATEQYAHQAFMFLLQHRSSAWIDYEFFYRYDATGCEDNPQT